MLVFHILFWFLVGGIAYAYVGYPMAAALAARLAPRTSAARTSPSWDLPRVTLIISVFNEEAVIAAKLRNTLALEYPRDKLDILVVSDASEDHSDTIVSSFASQGVRLLRQTERRGKTAALNEAMNHISGDVVVFSDANSLYVKSALKRLVEPFRHRDIGFVSGRTVYVRPHGLTMVDATNLYTRLEIFTKRMESRFSSCVGADGAIFAIRKTLYPRLDSADINDFVIPLHIVQQGYRGVLAQGAVCLETVPAEDSGEFRRQVRITARTLRALYRHRALMGCRIDPRFAFCLISHKLIKFLVPFFMAALLAVNVPLLWEGWIYGFFIAAQLAFYTMAYRSPTYRQPEHAAGMLLRLAHAFCMVNLAILLGWKSVLAGETFETWAPQRANHAGP